MVLYWEKAYLTSSEESIWSKGMSGGMIGRPSHFYYQLVSNEVCVAFCIYSRRNVHYLQYRHEGATALRDSEHQVHPP